MSNYQIFVKKSSNMTVIQIFSKWLFAVCVHIEIIPVSAFKISSEKEVIRWILSLLAATEYIVYPNWEDSGMTYLEPHTMAHTYIHMLKCSICVLEQFLLFTLCVSASVCVHSIQLWLPGTNVCRNRSGNACCLCTTIENQHLLFVLCLVSLVRSLTGTERHGLQYLEIWFARKLKKKFF